MLVQQSGKWHPNKKDMIGLNIPRRAINAAYATVTQIAI